MSTDFFGSPVEMSGRTPAYAPVRSAAVSEAPKNVLLASSRYSMSSSAGRMWSSSSVS
jgi:hypothetical protein